MSAPGCRATLKQMNDLYAPGAEGFADA